MGGYFGQQCTNTSLTFACKLSLHSNKLNIKINIQADLSRYYAKERQHNSWNKMVKGKAVLLQAWSGPEGSRKLSFPDFMTMAQDDGKVVSLTHRPPLPQEMHLVLISVRGSVNPRAIVRPEGLCH
jgi:hypothetical protein